MISLAQRHILSMLESALIALPGDNGLLLDNRSSQSHEALIEWERIECEFRNLMLNP